MSISRRSFVKRSSVALVAGPSLVMQGCVDAKPESVFAHGVSSGDPLADRIILWTRVTQPASQKNNPSVTVLWQIATDQNFNTLVNEGTQTTDSSKDFTVKVDADGLNAGQHYYYRFMAYGVSSPVGRTKTLPATNVEQVKIAFTSCSHFSFGYFNVYARMAEQDVDVVLHLGDYLYEYGNKDIYRNPFLLDRRHKPEGEMITLSDYRTRHGQYKGDKNLQKLHQTHPMICIWDDHEFTNDTWRGGAENHTEGQEGKWEDRAKAALKAYYEWMPIREPGSRGFNQDERERAYRRFRFGNLIDLNMLDTRYVGRDKQIDAFDGSELSPERSLLGFDQESWLESNLLKAQQEGVKWKLLGQQVQMLQIRVFGKYQNADAWDGYQAARNRLLDFIDRESIDNVAILTGDVHSSWAAEITKNPFDFAQYNHFTGQGAKAVEFVTPSVTSPSIPIAGVQQIVGDVAKVLRVENQHIRYIDFKNRGFVMLTIDQAQIQADWYHVPYVSFPNTTLNHAKRFTVKAGDPRLHPRF